MNIKDIKRAKPTLKVNYILIPVTKTDNKDEFNEVLAYYRNKNYNNIVRTKSGGISIKHFRGNGIDLRSTCWSIELIIIDGDGSFRLQFRSKIFDDPKIDENKLRITGKQSLNKFIAELKELNINLKDYAIDNGIEVNKTIEKPLIKVNRRSYLDMTFNNCHHIDISSSYPAGLKDYKPEFGPIIDEWYRLKQEGHKEYKAYLNLLVGIMHSKYIGYKYADMAKHAIEYNNNKIRNMADWLTNNNRTVIAYNTDGIWFTGEPIIFETKGLGQFRQDHTNCKLRYKSAGAYEFIENGIYNPVVRGKRQLELIKPKTEWVWGDIYKKEANLIKIYSVSLDKGIEEVYINEEKEYER